MRSVHSQQPDECGTGRGQRVGSVCMCRQVCEAEFLLVTRGRWGEKQPGSSSQLRQENSCWEVVGGGVGGRRGGLSVQHARSLPHTVQKPHTNRCTEEAPPENTGNVDKHTHTLILSPTFAVLQLISTLCCRTGGKYGGTQGRKLKTAAL